jgi:hypothetical protein
MCAVIHMAIFSSSLMSCFTGMLLSFFLTDFEMIQVAPFISGYHSFAFHIRCSSVAISSQSGLNLLQLSLSATLIVEFTTG